jgi:K(+)-stimulated pyrophosphate-energized sodium pump
MILIDADGKKQLMTAEQAADSKKAEVTKEVFVEMSVDGDLTTAEVITKTTRDGKTTSKSQVFKGTQDEVKNKVERLKNLDVNMRSN